jgi:hypothetical protein
MARLWPWSSGAPAKDEEHTQLEIEMGPDTNRETDLYGQRAEEPVRSGRTVVTKEQPPAK